MRIFLWGWLVFFTVQGYASSFGTPPENLPLLVTSLSDGGRDRQTGAHFYRGHWALLLSTEAITVADGSSVFFFQVPPSVSPIRGS